VLTGAPLAARPRCTGSWASGALTRAEQAAQSRIHGSIVREGAGYLWFEDDDICGLGCALRVFATNKRAEIGAFVLRAELVGLFAASLLHRFVFRPVSRDVH